MQAATFWRTVTKDLGDIARLLEGHAELRELVPQSLRQRLIA